MNRVGSMMRGLRQRGLGTLALGDANNATHEWLRGFLPGTEVHAIS